MSIDTVARGLGLLAESTVTAAIEAIREEFASSFAGNTWYVSATGSSGNTGLSPASPWTLTYALASANTTVQPGDRIWCLDSGGVYPTLIAYSRGTASKPVLVQNAPGHKPKISGAISGITYTLIDAGLQLYESTTSVSATTNNRQVLGFIFTENDWHTLMPDRWGGLTPSTPAISQTSHLYRTDGVFYPGPMIMPMTNGKIRVRLQNSTSAAMRNKVTVQIADPNPTNNQLKIFDANSTGITVRGSNLIFDGLDISDCFQAFYMDTGSATVENIIIQGCYSRFGYFFFRGASARNVTIRYNTLEGKMGYSTHWIGFSEVKGASTLGEPMRKCAMQMDGVQTASIYGNYIDGCFDGVLGGAMYDIEYGKFSDVSTGDIRKDELAHFNNANILIHCVDDAFQIYAADQKVHIHHNYFYGAGPTLDGDSSGTYHGEEFPVIHHNVLDARRTPIWWQREPDPTDPNFATTDPIGIRYPAPFGGHGLGDTGGYYYPFQYYHNTVYFVNNFVTSRFESFQANFAITPLGGQPSPFKHVVANNLILVEMTGNWGWIARNVAFDKGREWYDGNLIVKTDSTFNPIYRFGYRGGASVAPSNGVATFASLRTENSGLDWAATKVYYTIGWDASSVQLSQSPIGAINDAGAPILAQAATGAADLTSLGLKGLSTYQSWIGARAPLS